jgi:hypothetical protein
VLKFSQIKLKNNQSAANSTNRTTCARVLVIIFPLGNKHRSWLHISGLLRGECQHRNSEEKTKVIFHTSNNSAAINNLLGEVLNNIFKLCQDNGAVPEDWEFAIWREKRRANMSDLNGSSTKFDVGLKSYQIIVTFPKYFKAFCIPKP